MNVVSSGDLANGVGLDGSLFTGSSAGSATAGDTPGVSFQSVLENSSPSSQAPQVTSANQGQAAVPDKSNATVQKGPANLAGKTGHETRSAPSAKSSNKAALGRTSLRQANSEEKTTASEAGGESKVDSETTAEDSSSSASSDQKEEAQDPAVPTQNLETAGLLNGQIVIIPPALLPLLPVSPDAQPAKSDLAIAVVDVESAGQQIVSLSDSATVTSRAGTGTAADNSSSLAASSYTAQSAGGSIGIVKTSESAAINEDALVSSAPTLEQGEVKDLPSAQLPTGQAEKATALEADKTNISGFQEQTSGYQGAAISPTVARDRWVKNGVEGKMVSEETVPVSDEKQVLIKSEIPGANLPGETSFIPKNVEESTGPAISNSSELPENETVKTLTSDLATHQVKDPLPTAFGTNGNGETFETPEQWTGNQFISSNVAKPASGTAFTPDSNDLAPKYSDVPGPGTMFKTAIAETITTLSPTGPIAAILPDSSLDLTVAAESAGAGQNIVGQSASSDNANAKFELSGFESNDEIPEEAIEAPTVVTVATVAALRPAKEQQPTIAPSEKLVLASAKAKGQSPAQDRTNKVAEGAKGLESASVKPLANQFGFPEVARLSAVNKTGELVSSNHLPDGVASLEASVQQPVPAQVTNQLSTPTPVAQKPQEEAVRSAIPSQSTEQNLATTEATRSDFPVSVEKEVPSKPVDVPLESEKRGELKVSSAQLRVVTQKGRSQATNFSGTLDAQQAPDMLLTANNKKESNSFGKNIPAAGKNDSAEAVAEKILPDSRISKDEFRSERSVAVSGVAGMTPGLQFERHSGVVLSDEVHHPEPKVIAQEVWSAVESFRRTGAQDWEMKIRPTDQTEINLKFAMENNRLVVHAKVERGDLGAIASNWNDLQAALADRGVQLKPLEMGTGQQNLSGNGGGSSFAQTGFERQGNGQRQAPFEYERQQSAGAHSTFGKPSAERKQSQSIPKPQRNQGLETWA